MRKSVGRIAVAMALLSLAGCGGNQAMSQKGAVAEPAASGHTSKAAPAGQPGGGRGSAISDSVLDGLGFTSLWTWRPKEAEGPFQSAFLLPEGIFVVSRPHGGEKLQLIRFDLETGLPVWYYPLDHPIRHAPVAYHYSGPPGPEGPRPDELYILQEDMLRCLDLTYGAEMWRTQLNFPVSCGPVVDESQYYIGSYNRNIYAIQKKKGVDQWNYITSGEVKAPGVATSSGEVYFASTDKGVYRLESQGGWKQGRSWRYFTGGRVVGSPVFFSRWIYVGSTDFKLYAFERDGSRAWEFPAEAAILDTPVVMSFRPDKPMVFCISQDDRRGEEKRVAWAVDAKTGQSVWHRNHVAQVVGIGRRSVYLLPDVRPGRDEGARRILALDALKGDEVSSIPADGFDFVPTNDSDHGTNQKARGIIYLISRSGLMQAIREKP